MFCPKCHTELDDNAKFCKRCGTEQKKSRKKFHWNQFSSSKTFERMNMDRTINKELEEIFEEEKISKEDHNETHQNQYNYSKNYSNVIKDNNEDHKDQYSYSQNYSNTSQKQITSDQDYIDSYIGPNAALIEKQNVSVLTAFFGPFYLLYRKLWTQSIILLIIYVCSYIYLNDSLGMILRVIVNIIMAAKFKDIYLTEVSKRVEQIKTQNPDKSSNELLEICKTKGGLWSFGNAVLLFILYFIVVVILINRDAYTQMIQKQNNSTRKEIRDMYYEINESMTEKDLFKNYHYFIDRKNNGTCYITVTAETTRITPKEYLLEEIDIYDSYVPKSVTNFKIGGNDGSYISINMDNTQKEFYAIKNNDTIYALEFEDTNYKYKNCSEDKNKVIDTISWKQS